MLTAPEPTQGTLLSERENVINTHLLPGRSVVDDGCFPATTEKKLNTKILQNTYTMLTNVC